MPSAVSCLAARGVAWRVGLLGGSRADRVDRVDRAAETGDAVDCFEERVPRFVGEDILCSTPPGNKLQKGGNHADWPELNCGGARRTLLLHIMSYMPEA